MAGRSRTNVPSVVYKDFQPQIDRKEEQGANILIIHLPDFQKEKINVTYVDATRSIKVQAEKAVEKNTRSRINQSFPVPENCITEKIQGSLRNGVLTITMPRRTVTRHPLDSTEDVNNVTKHKPSVSSSTSGVEKQRDKKLKSPPKNMAQPKPPVATTALKPIAEPKPPVATTALKPIAEPKPPAATTVEKPISEPKPPAATVAKPIAEHKPPVATVAKPIAEPKPPVATMAKPIAEPKPPVATVAKQMSEPKPPMAVDPQIPKEKNKGKEFEALPPSKQQEEIQRKVSPIAKQTGEKKAGGSMPTATPEIVEKKDETKDGLKVLVKEKAKDSMPEAADILKTTEKASTVEKKLKDSGSGFQEMKGVNAMLKTVKRLSTDDAEDRKLLINIGVSVLVVVALGAYITYSYRSSGKAKN